MGRPWSDTLNLTERDGKTTLTMTILYPSKDARDAATGTVMKEGMNLSYRRLAEQLAARE